MFSRAFKDVFTVLRGLEQTFNSGDSFGVESFGGDSNGTECSLFRRMVFCRCFDNIRSWAVSFLDNSCTRLIMAYDNNFVAMC